MPMSLCDCAFCVRAHSSDTRIPPPLIPAYIFTAGHAVMLVSSSAGQGTLVNSTCESAMTSRHAYSCGVNKCCSALTPEAKKRRCQDCQPLVLLHILIIAISDLIQDVCWSKCLDKKTKKKRLLCQTFCCCFCLKSIGTFWPPPLSNI